MARRPVALVLALLLAVLVTGTANAADLEPRWADEDFTDGVPTDPGWRLWGWGTSSQGHDGRTMGTWLNKGEFGAAGGQVDLRTLSGRSYVDQAYFRYWLWLDDDFYVQPPNRGKLPGLAALNNTYRCLGGKQSTTSQPCWTARQIFSRTYPAWGQEGYPNGPDDKTLLGTYLYHLDVPDHRLPYGDILMWDESVATLDHGRWYCVEGHVRMNTPGVADGRVRGWVDGQVGLDRQDIRYRRAGESSLGVQTMWMDLYHGGGDPSAADNEVRIDSLAVGPQRIGCSDGAVHDGTFSDDDRSVHQQAIEQLVSDGITTGCDPRRAHRFCPAGTVTRGPLAVFVADALGLPDGGTRFVDVVDDRFARATSALAAAGGTRGCDDQGNFCPQEPIQRNQLAAIVNRLLDLPEGHAAPQDVRQGSLFSQDIAAVIDAGILAPCRSDGSFCPDRPVTREILADVVTRLAASYGQTLAPAAEEQAVTAEPDAEPTPVPSTEPSPTPSPTPTPTSTDAEG